MAAIPFEVENLVRWDGFADTQALKVFFMPTARAASQRHTEHVHRQSTAFLDACFHTDMNELIRAHPPRETEPEGSVIQLLSKAHSGARRATQACQEFFRSEVFVSAGGNAEAMEPHAYHKAAYWDDEDSDSFMVAWRMDIKSATIIETATKIVKQVSNWRSVGITWVGLKPNIANELSWDRAQPRSLADGTETYLVGNCRQEPRIDQETSTRT